MTSRSRPPWVPCRAPTANPIPSALTPLGGTPPLACCLLLCFGAMAHADIPLEKAHVEILPDHVDKNWFWVWGNGAPAQSSSRAYLFDDNGKQLGMLSIGYWAGNILPSPKHEEVYSVETYFSRGVRGERSDVVTVYDPKTLKVKREIKVPAKRMTAVDTQGMAVLSDDERFLLMQNYTPAQSLTVVDLDSSKFVTEVETPGCASVYTAGDRDFYSLCGDGGFFHLRLDNAGHPIVRERIPPLFDPIKDFLTTEASRLGNAWYFVSGDNNVYAMEMDANGVKLAKKWSLVTDKERKDNWRISGYGNTAIHNRSGQLYVLMHQGGPETRNEPGTEAWVFDIKTQKRVRTIELNELSLSLGVSQGETPRLYSVDVIFPMPTLAKLWVYFTKGQDALMKVFQNGIAIYDAQSGKLLRQIDGLPASYLSAVKPW